MKRLDKALLLIKSDLEEAAMLIESIEEYRLVTLNPLGHRPIKDIDEIHNRNRRKTDDPYIRATSEKIAHHFPEIDDAERR